jgi:DNA-binding NtrC family response regulator
LVEGLIKSRRIMVVDDDMLVGEYLAALLTSEDYDVKVLNQPIEALQYFTDNPDDFDLVITDQIMPELTGIEISQEIIKIRPNTPVLLITGYCEKITADNAKLFGLSGFFSKPINEELFLNEISQLIPCPA